jgi:hypothetical protein
MILTATWATRQLVPGGCSLAQFISAGSNLPSTSGTDFSKLERAAVTGRCGSSWAQYMHWMWKQRHFGGGGDWRKMEVTFCAIVNGH